MIDHSAAFAAAVRAGFHAVAVVEVVHEGRVVAELHPVDGTVTMDRSAATLRRAEVTLTDPDGTLTPTQAADLLTPFLAEIRPYLGVVIPATQTIADIDDTQADWAAGALIGVVATAAGDLTLAS